MKNGANNRVSCLGKEELVVLEAIVRNNISAIDYYNPSKSLQEYIPIKGFDCASAVHNINNGTHGVLDPKARSIFGWEYSAKYIVDLKKAKEVYEAAKFF